MTREEKRVIAPQSGKQSWRSWGPYLSERQWGTVREDYTRSGDAWNAISHDKSRHYAYRWGEDGIGGFSDDQARICLSVALWNGRDAILKERLFGLSNPEGNHGEDVKEVYNYLDATPTHSYGKMLYKYPQAHFPYTDLVNKNAKLGKFDREYEIEDTGVFDDDKYFDVCIEHAKAAPDDIHFKITVTNKGPETAPICVIPQAWFRNTWSAVEGISEEVAPHLHELNEKSALLNHPKMEDMIYHCPTAEELIYCDNETDRELLNLGPNKSGYPKNSFHKYIVESDAKAVNPDKDGTKVGAPHFLQLKPQESKVIYIRLSSKRLKYEENPERIFEKRIEEANSFYDAIQKNVPTEELKNIQRQSLSGLLWSKQYYYYNVAAWLDGDAKTPAPPEERRKGRNHHWRHLVNEDIISMPDKWEYPWYAAWDLAFHCIPLALVDPEFAKKQLLLMLSEKYMHPNGQIPAYEWQLSDVNPPVHAWGVRRVFEIERKKNNGIGDHVFLESAFHKLLINFTWWVNRKDEDGNNIFQGGFLGLDNIGVFDRSADLPTGGSLSQADGTAWMGFYCIQMMQIAIELAMNNPVYESSVIKFFNHFVSIANAMNHMGKSGLWNEEDGFFYDVLNLPDGRNIPMKLKSMVGLIPLYSAEVIDNETLLKLPKFSEHMLWYMKENPEHADLIPSVDIEGEGTRTLFSLVSKDRLRRILDKVFDPEAFLSDYGIRGLSKEYGENPFCFSLNPENVCEHIVRYQPAESDSDMFGGNSNWRGPVWFPVNYLLFEGLQRFAYYYQDTFLINHPSDPSKALNLSEVSEDLAERMVKLFTENENGELPAHLNHPIHNKEGFKENIMFYEYFHGDTGRGLGASHQTGWTGLVAKMIEELYP